MPSLRCRECVCKGRRWALSLSTTKVCLREASSASRALHGFRMAVHLPEIFEEPARAFETSCDSGFRVTHPSDD